MKIKISGVDIVNKNLTNIRRSANTEVQKAIVAATVETESKAKQRAPVDTGRLRSSIYSTIRNMMGKTTVNVDYGVYQEFGTGSNVDFSYIDDGNIRRQARTAASEFRGSGQKNSNITGKHYLLSAFLDARDSFYRKVNNIFK